MAKGIRSLLDTVMQALPQVGNLGLLFYLLFFIFAALGVELFGRLGKYYKQNQKINEPPPRPTGMKCFVCFIAMFRLSRMRRRPSVPGTGRARSLCQLWNCVLDAVPGGHGRQLERHHEGHAAGELRSLGRLHQELLRVPHHRSHLFRHLRPDGPVRPGQRRRRRSHETPRGIAQTGNATFTPLTPE